MECTVENKKLVPLSKVVNSAIIDVYGDIGRMQQRSMHFAARGLKKLYTEALPKVKHKVWLTVNTNTHTATLPLDYYEETFVGFVDYRWHKVPIKLNTNITDRKNIIDVPCEDKCPKCNQDTSICNDLVVTEEVNLIVINDTTYEQTIVKKLYPNGDYYLETTTPVLNIETNTVDTPYPVKKEFIVNFDLKPCGCLETSDLNTSNLQTYCPDIYCNYYAPCDTRCCTDYGGYKIFEESGLIQMDTSYPFDKVYLEYYGYITKKNGAYYVPQVSFETLVEWTKWKQIANKSNVTRWERLDQLENYKRERKNMMKVLGRVSLYQIIQAAAMLPKFNVDYGSNWYGCFGGSSVDSSLLNATFGSSTGSTTVSTNSSGECCITNNNTIINRTGFVLALKVDGNPGSPVNGESVYQNNLLIGATDLQFLFLAKQVLSKIDSDFSFNSVTGTIDISPNTFFTNDSLIIPYNKNI